MRYLAIDLGDVRTGLAVGDDETRLATPAGVVEASGDRLVEAIERTAADHGVGAVVVGLPLNMDGTEGPRARATRAFGGALGARLGLPVHYADERLTSAEAGWRLAGSGLTRGQKKNRRDAVAAAAILRSFFASRGETG
ncbi:MAG: Holliday junction resolvase RuvX [Planctomycetota bacterium]|nr:MAG: Holliday junction resolvase RuvX [Planctomycetota bacterium]